MLNYSIIYFTNFVMLKLQSQKKKHHQENTWIKFVNLTWKNLYGMSLHNYMG